MAQCLIIVADVILEFMAGGTLLEYLLEQDRQQQSSPDKSLLRGLRESLLLRACQLKERVPLAEIACRDIMYQLCQAMAYVHSLGIVHCNLKPEVRVRGLLLRPCQSPLLSEYPPHWRRNPLHQSCWLRIGGPI
jgi:hypothetical protein